MIAFDEAVSRLLGAVEPLGKEGVPLAHAGNRFLAEPVLARQDAPRCDVSAMDGYAVRRAEALAGLWFDIVGESRAGAAWDTPLEPGQAARIATGAIVPQGADCVIMQEYAQREESRVRFGDGHGPAHHIRVQGSDFKTGQMLLAAGTRLTPRALVSAAAADLAELYVYRQPRVVLIATGDELAPPGEALERANAIPETIGVGLAAMVQSLGGIVAARHCEGDRPDRLETLAGEALAASDCVVVTGGASVGERDFSRMMFARHGLEEIFSRVAIKPGRPVWFGKAGGAVVLGLPGNPTSAMVTARLFLQPLLAALQGGDGAQLLADTPQILAAPLPQNDARETFFRAQASGDGLIPIANQQSGAQAPLAASDWLIRRAPHAPACASGEVVRALAF